MPDFSFTDDEHDILDVALSYMLANLDDVNDAYDLDFSEEEVKTLREDLADEVYDDEEDE